MSKPSRFPSRQDVVRYVTADPITSQAVDAHDKAQAAVKRNPTDEELRTALHFLRESVATIEEELLRRGQRPE